MLGSSNGGWLLGSPILSIGGWLLGSPILSIGGWLLGSPILSIGGWLLGSPTLSIGGNISLGSPTIWSSIGRFGSGLSLSLMFPSS